MANCTANLPMLPPPTVEWYNSDRDDQAAGIMSCGGYYTQVFFKAPNGECKIAVAANLPDTLPPDVAKEDVLKILHSRRAPDGRVHNAFAHR